MPAAVAYSAYGAPALSELRRLVADLKGEDLMAPVTVVVPSNIAGLVARRHLAGGLTQGANGVAGIWFTTLPRLAERLAAPALTARGRRPATRPITSAAIRAVLDAEPGQFGSVAGHPSTARALAHAGTALRDVDDTAVEAVARTSTLCRDVTRVHRQVAARLGEQWYDTTDLLATATGLVVDDTVPVGEAGTIVLYLPQDLSRAETAFARALVSHAPTHLVVGLTGNARADGTVLTTVNALAPDAPAPPSLGEPTAHRVMHASDSDDEIRCVVRGVVRSLRTTPAHRVAVLYADRSPYARLLHEHLGAAGITVNGSGVRPVVERGPSRLVLGLLQTARSGYRRADVLRTLGEVAVHDFDGQRITVPQWERVARAAGVVDGTDWGERLATLRAGEEQTLAQPDAHQAKRARVERTVTAIDALSSFMTELGARLDAARTQTTWAGTAAHLLELVHTLLPSTQRRRLPLEEQHAADTIERTLSGLAALDDTGAVPTLDAVEEVLGLELELALPRVGRFGEGVFVGPLGQAVGMDLDTVYVVGLSEDLCPGTLHEDSLLPERSRQATGGQLPSTRRRLDTAHRALLAAFASAPHAVASFPRGDLRRHTHRLPSRWLLPTLRHLTGDSDLPATEWERGAVRAGERLDGSPSFAGRLLRDEPATHQEWRVRAFAAGQPVEDAAVAAAQEMQRARASEEFTRFDGNLAGQDGLPDFRAEGKLVSPTALESYARCPHAYFVSKVLYVEPVEDPDQVIDISAMDLGNFVHRSMDRLVSEVADAGELPGYGQPWSARHRERLIQVADEVAATLEAEGRTGHPLLWARKRTQVLGWLDRMLTDDDVWRAELDARVVASELAFGKDGSPPVVLDLGDGAVVRLRGSADKVDQCRDGKLLVTDIKTGRKTAFTRLSEANPVDGGEKLQLPVYALAARAAHGDEATEVEASYWFTGKDRGRVPVLLTEPVRQTYVATVRLLVESIASGVFPQRAPDGPDWQRVQCAYCNPDGIGHAAARERWEAKRLSPALLGYTALVEPDALPAEAEDHSIEARTR